MAQHVPLIAGLLMIVGVQASHMEDQSRVQRFLSKTMPFGFGASKSVLGDYDKFITRKHRGGPDTAFYRHSPDQHGFATDEFKDLDAKAENGRLGTSIVGDGPLTAIYHEAGHPAAHSQHAMASTLTRGDPFLNTKHSNPSNVADEDEKKAVQNLLTNDNSASKSLFAIGAASLAFVVMLGVRMRRRLQPATVLAGSGTHGSGMPVDMASVLPGDILEIKSHETTLKSGASSSQTPSTAGENQKPMPSFSSATFETGSCEVEMFAAVPGLVLLPNFLSEVQQLAVFERARGLAQEVHAQAQSSNRKPIPAPLHNLSLSSRPRGSKGVRRELIRIFLSDEKHVNRKASGVAKARISGEHFLHYGDGHRLTYFRGTENIPDVGLGVDWLSRLEGLPWVKQELIEQREQRGLAARDPATWRMTLNHYPPSPGIGDGQPMRRGGFPWHRDIEANGAATIILALGGSATLEFGYESEADDGLAAIDGDHDVKSVASVVVHPGSLLVLSGPARWNLLHRVRPAEGANACERVSVVFGCW